MEFNQDFNAQDHEGFTPIPDGWYKAVIVSSDGKSTRDGQGQYIAMQYQIIEGKFANRRIFQNVNWVNPNKPDAEAMGKRIFSNICRAVGIEKKAIKRSEEVHELPLAINVGQRFNDFKQENENVIKNVKSVKEVDFGEAQTDTSKPVWQQKKFAEDDVPF